MSKTYAKLWQDHKAYLKATTELEQREASKLFADGNRARFEEIRERRNLAEHMHEMMLLAEDEMDRD